MTTGNALARPPCRHDLAWPCDWPDTLPEAARSWLSAGRPAVVCRRETSARGSLETSSPVRLGLALPAAPGSGEKPGRCAWETRLLALRRVRPPLTLAEALPAAPADWRQILTRLCQDGERGGIEWRVFGSLAWQALGEGNLQFLDAIRSDIDLLVTPADPAQFDAALALLHAADGNFPLRLDGEILFPGDWAVSWREWSAAPRQVLAKHTTAGVALRCPGKLRASLDAPPVPASSCPCDSA